MQGLLPVAVCLSAALLAQEPHVPAALTPPPFAGLFVADPQPDGATWVRGDRYKLGLTAQGAHYQPLFGPQAPRDFPLHLQLAQLTVDGDELPLANGAEWRRRENHFTRERGAAREGWQVLADGAQQYFEIPQPDRLGSLTLRIAVATDLLGVDDGPGLRFLAPGLGEVRCSDATVFDANGARLDVPVGLGEGQLTITVPAAFTRNARWPLLVDPLLTTVAVDATVSQRRNPRVACEPTTGNWLVVAEEHLSAADIDIVCSRYSSANPPVLLDTVYADNSTNLTRNCDVGFVAQTQRFIVGWHDATVGEFQLRNRQAASTTQGGTIGIGGGIGSDPENTVRFGSSYAADRFLFVMFRHQGGAATPFTSIEAVLFASAGTLFTSVSIPVGSFVNIRNITSPGEVSPIASASDKWVVAWPSMTGTFLPNYLISMQAIGFTGSTGPLVQEPVVLLSGVNSTVVKAASIAGRGGNLLAVWERVNATTGSDVLGVPIGIVGGVYAPLGSVQNFSALEPNGIPALAQREPDVSFDGTRFVYGYLEDNGAGVQLPHAATVFVSGSSVAWHEGHLPLGTANASTFDLGFGANGNPGVHWAVFQQAGVAGNSDVQAAIVDARAPGITSVVTQTGCGLPSEPGIALAGTPALGRPFTVSLNNVPVFPILLVGPESISALPGCGTCQLGIDAAGLQLFAGASLVVNVPSNPALLNLRLAFQGMSGLQAGGCPAAFAGFDFALSDTLTIQVQ